MANLVSQYNELSKKFNKLNEINARYKGKIESLTESLEQAGFNSVKEAESWLEKANKEKADIENELNELLESVEVIMEKI